MSTFFIRAHAGRGARGLCRSHPLTFCAKYENYDTKYVFLDTRTTIRFLTHVHIVNNRVERKDVKTACCKYKHGRSAFLCSEHFLFGDFCAFISWVSCILPLSGTPREKSVRYVVKSRTKGVKRRIMASLTVIGWLCSEWEKVAKMEKCHKTTVKIAAFINFSIICTKAQKKSV